MRDWDEYEARRLHDAALAWLAGALGWTPPSASYAAQVDYLASVPRRAVFQRPRDDAADALRETADWLAMGDGVTLDEMAYDLGIAWGAYAAELAHRVERNKMSFALAVATAYTIEARRGSP